MSRSTVTFVREALYAEVWREPLRTVARRHAFGCRPAQNLPPPRSADSTCRLLVKSRVWQQAPCRCLAIKLPRSKDHVRRTQRLATLLSARFEVLGSKYSGLGARATSGDRISGSRPIDCAEEEAPLMLRGIVPRADDATALRVRFLRRSQTQASARLKGCDGGIL